MVCDWTVSGTPTWKFTGHFPSSRHFCFLPPPKGNTMLRYLNITLMVAKTTEEKQRVLMTLWVAMYRGAVRKGDWFGVQKGKCFLKSLTLGI